MLADYGILLGEATGETGGGYGLGRILEWAQSMTEGPGTVLIIGAVVAVLLFLLLFKR